MNSDCGRWAHWSYTYIDMLCSNPEDLFPEVNIGICGSSICSGLDFEVFVDPGLYDEYQWKSCKVNSQGIEYDCYTSDIITGYTAELEDVENFYTSQSDFSFECGVPISLTFIALNTCGETEETIIFDYVCSDDYTVEYCNEVVYCSEEADVQLIGNVNCPNCTFEWSPIEGLSNPFTAFPTVTNDYIIDAFSREYNVKVTTPEGCVFKESVSLVRNTAQVSYFVDRDYCNNYITATVRTNESPQNVWLDYNGNQRISMELLDSESTEGEYVYYRELSRRNNYENVAIDATTFSNQLDDPECLVGDPSTCVKPYIEIGDFSSSQFFGPLNVFIPNVFSPNGDGENDTWHPFYKTIPQNTLEGSTKVFDRAGSLVHASYARAPSIDGLGITGHELAWDGKFKGQLLNSGTVLVYFHNFSNCDNPPPNRGAYFEDLYFMELQENPDDSENLDNALECAGRCFEVEYDGCAWCGSLTVLF